jgi:hypothetical protein
MLLIICYTDDDYKEFEPIANAGLESIKAGLL